ncbi:MAG: HAMP domain-containing histidine kinase [Akkermansiaceae bacterium]|nr:HAMP domain-containing histidine kinase [Akkermansiaceae bacterium]
MPEMSRPWKLPLFGHVLVWFFLNLAVLAIACGLLLHFRWRAGFDSLLVSGAMPRLTGMAAAVAGELRATDPGEWPDVLARMGESFGNPLYLARPDGQPLQGIRREWPEEVSRRLQASFPRPPRGQRPPPEGPIAGEGSAEVFAPGPPEDRPRPGPPRPSVNRPIVLPDGSNAPATTGEGIPAGSVVPPSLALWHREADGTFWAAMRVRMPVPGRPVAGPSEVILLARADSLAGSGWMPDPRPWIWVAGGALGISALVWWPFVRLITRRLRAMDAATARLAEGEFDVRLHPGPVRELADLAVSIESMSARLKDLLQGQRRFLGDVAHELCSPLARMEMGLGILETKLAPAGGVAADPAERDPLSDVREDLREMAGLVHELLSFTRAGMGGAGIQAATLEIGPLIREVAAREGMEDLRLDGPDGASVLADRDLLRRAFANLFRNALRHAGPGPIHVVIESEEPMDKGWRITVRDEGPGVPEAELPHLFEPFYRPDASRSRETGGTGLGLAIVRSCIQGCGGSVSLRNAPEGGLEVMLRLRGENH